MITNIYFLYLVISGMKIFSDIQFVCQMYLTVKLACIYQSI